MSLAINLPLSGKHRESVNKGIPIPGWKEIVSPSKQDSLFWHSVWLSAGRPRTGALYQVMCHARRKYHLAVRHCKNIASATKAQKLSEAAENGGHSSF